MANTSLVSHIDVGDVFVGQENINKLLSRFTETSPLKRFVTNHEMNNWLMSVGYEDNALLKPKVRDIVREVAQLNEQFINYLHNTMIAALPNESKAYTPYHMSRTQDLVNYFNENPKQGVWRAMGPDRYDPAKLQRQKKRHPAAMNNHHGIRPHETELSEAMMIPDEYTQYRGWRKGINTLRRSGNRYN